MSLITKPVTDEDQQTADANQQSETKAYTLKQYAQMPLKNQFLSIFR